MKVVVSRTANEDGWKPVTLDGMKIGHVRKVGDYWRARWRNAEHLNFKSSRAAAAHLEKLLKKAEAEKAAQEAAREAREAKASGS